jgi:hypothetical protein
MTLPRLRGTFVRMNFDNFDRIRVINLPHRKDRRAEMENQLAKVGLRNHARIEFFPARQFDEAGMFRSAGSRGCFTSHRDIVAEAANAGQSVLIFEDDCDFLPAVHTYELPKDFDLFYGGFVASDPNDPANSDIIGSHFLGLSARATKLAAAYFTDYGEQGSKPDARAAAEPGFNPNVRPGADGAYVWFRRAHPDLETVFVHLSVQRRSRTDIGKLKWFDRLPVVRGLAGMARKLKGQSSGAGYVFR